MSARMQFPLSQRRHTNIAVVRYTRNGVKLEIACYKNKVISYRSGTEDRLDEVLQVERVFSNVARGLIAPEKDIAAVFGTSMTEQEAIRYILLHGDLQVAQHERTCEVDEMFKDIAVIIAQKCINEHTQRPFPSQVVEQALRSIGAAVKLDQPIKKQVLSLIHQLIDSRVIPIARANMKLRCNTSSSALRDRVEMWCREHGADILSRRGGDANSRTGVKGDSANHACNTNAAGSSQGVGAEDQTHTPHSPSYAYSLLIAAKPHLYRELDTFIKEHMPAKSATLHTVQTAMAQGIDEDVTESAGWAEAPSAPVPPTAADASPSSAPAWMGECGGDRTEVMHVERHTHDEGGDDSEDGEEMSDAESGREAVSRSGHHSSRAGKKGGNRTTTKNKSKNTSDSSSEDDEDEQRDVDCTGTRKKKKVHGAAKGVPDALGAVAAELRKLGLDLDSDVLHDAASKRGVKKRGGGGGTSKCGMNECDHAESKAGSTATGDGAASSKRAKKNAHKKGGATSSLAAQSPAKRGADTPENSDDEVECNRRQRKNAKAKGNAATKNNNYEYNSEDEFDYGDDEEGDTQEG